MTGPRGPGHGVFVRSPTLLVASLVAPLLVVACGGKIADDPTASVGEREGEGAGLPAPAASPPPTEPSKAHVGDVCGTICRRHARCGAHQDDCAEHCAEETREAGFCSPVAKAFMQCYADNIEPDSCTVVPPVCEEAYCAYTRCAGKVGPSYCP